MELSNSEIRGILKYVFLAQRNSVLINHIYSSVFTLGKSKKLDIWIPYDWSQKNPLDRMVACDSLMKRNEIDQLSMPILTSPNPIKATGDTSLTTRQKLRELVQTRPGTKRLSPVQAFAKLCCW